METITNKFSVILAENSAVEVKGRYYPCVILFGRDKDNNRVKYRIKFFPYFYLQEKDYLALKDTKYFKSLPVQEISGTRARNLVKKVMTKITVQDAGRVTDTIKAVNKMNKQWYEKQEKPIFTYEADLSKADLLPLRFLIDKGIKSGVQIVGNELVPTDISCKLRKWYIDFEVYTTKEYSSGLGPDEPIIMVTIWDNYENKLYTFYVNNPKWIIFKAGTKYGLNHMIKSFKTEANLLDALMELLINKDPDILIAWNLYRFDIEKWKQRVEVNGKKCIYRFKDISPLKNILWNNRPKRIKGRVLFDLMKAFKQFTDAELVSYALQFITEEEKLGYPKIQFKGTSGNTWDNYPEIMFQRNINDVLIIKALDEKYELVETYDDLRTEFGALFHEIFMAHRIIDTVLMRLVNGKVVLRTTEYAKKEEQEKLLGALIKQPEESEEYYVAQFDFGREYPKIIRAFNISPETYREYTSQDESQYKIEYEHPDKGYMIFRFTKKPIGLIPQLITYFFNKRDEYDREYKKAIDNKEPESVIKMWDRRSYNAKKKVNAVYGVLDFNKFRLYKKECTQATAIIGRIVIEELSKFLESIGYILKYADTDSLFVKLKNNEPEKCLLEAQMLQAQLNEHIVQFFDNKYNTRFSAELGLKKIYKKIMFIEKKHYAGKSIYDEKKGWKTEYDIKGVASIRSDSSNLERTVIETLLKLKLDDENINIIEKYVNKILQDFEDRKFDYIDISYPAQIKKKLYYSERQKKWLTDYAKKNKKGRIQIPAHITAAVYSNIYLNTDFSRGDKPRRLSVKLPEGVRKGQKLLFDNTKTTYPTEFEWYNKVRKVRDISIVEDMKVPQFFLDNIDYERIGERLQKKIDKIINIGKKKIEEEKTLLTTLI